MGRVKYLLILFIVGIAVYLIMTTTNMKETVKLAKPDETKKLLCKTNLQAIDNAKAMWALNNNEEETSELDWEDLAPVYLKRPLKCPAGGEYTINSSQEKATCSIKEHNQ